MSWWPLLSKPTSAAPFPKQLIWLSSHFAHPGSFVVHPHTCPRIVWWTKGISVPLSRYHSYELLQPGLGKCCRHPPLNSMHVCLIFFLFSFVSTEGLLCLLEGGAFQDVSWRKDWDYDEGFCLNGLESLLRGIILTGDDWEVECFCGVGEDRVEAEECAAFLLVKVFFICTQFFFFEKLNLLSFQDRGLTFFVTTSKIYIFRPRRRP